MFWAGEGCVLDRINGIDRIAGGGGECGIGNAECGIYCREIPKLCETEICEKGNENAKIKPN